MSDNDSNTAQLNTVTDLIMNRLAAHRELIEQLSDKVRRLESQVAMLDPIGHISEDEHRWEELEGVFQEQPSHSSFLPLEELYHPDEEVDGED